ncbi:O-antigen ligase [Pseudolabrys sp. FHR47]|uniref:O-antigen ligase family protein n=1 Tax=Pseudolabrys sp. FHR47 TaxID=2562284 RepID=UPI0010BEEE09|nr:O-antigen ligase family protein [Pseudolabrys sp. FHR47]
MTSTRPGIVYFVLPFGLLCAAAAVAAMPLVEDDMTALGLLALTPAALIGFYAVAQGALGERHFGAVMAVVYIFVAAAIFRIRDYDDKSIDFQVAGKLGSFAMILATTALFYSFAIGRLRFPRLFFVWLAFFAALMGCALYAVKVPFALTCALLFLTCYLYAIYLSVWLSRRVAVQVMMCAALLLCAGSIFVYFAIPSIGVMQAWTAEGGFGEIGRMKGLTGSANGIGFIAAFGAAMAILYYRSLDVFGRSVALALIPSALICLVLSNNRSSMMALAAALWVGYVFRRNAAPKILLTVTIGMVVAAALVFFSDEIFALLSRSGRAEEITSATGRSAIWSVVLDMWAERPFTGYGYTSALAILPLDPRLFHVAAHAHNMYLELLFAGGIALLALFLYALWQTFRQAHRLGAVNEAALLVFFMLRGMTEATPFSGMVGYASIAFALTLALVIAPLVQPRVAAARLNVPGPAPMPRELYP